MKEITTSQGNAKSEPVKEKKKVAFFTPADNQPSTGDDATFIKNIAPSLRPYATQFLVKKEPLDLSPTRQEISKRAQKILSILSLYSKQCGEQVGITTLLNNILESHFDQHREEIIKIHESYKKAEIARLDSIEI